MADGIASILTSVKSALGIAESDTSFDADLVMHINSVLADLNDFGVGPNAGFAIADKTAVWADFTGDLVLLNTTKSYLYLRVRLLFDPPETGPANQAFQAQIDQMAWRLQTRVETNTTVDANDDGVPDGMIDGISLDLYYQNAKV